MTTKSEYMLVMIVSPPNGRRYKTRIFINSNSMDSCIILDQEMLQAKRSSVDPKDVITVNVVKLQ